MEKHEHEVRVRGGRCVICGADAVAIFNAAQNAFYRKADEAGTNDRGDVTSGDGYSRFDEGDE